jgi:hypothetical protein
MCLPSPNALAEAGPGDRAAMSALAVKLARATVAGAGELMRTRAACGRRAAGERDSPQGNPTQAALEVLMAARVGSRR